MMGLIVLLAFCSGIVSCSSDPHEPGTDPTDGEEGYFSVSLAIENVRGRTKGDVTETEGTASENHVDNIVVVLYGQDNIAKYVFNYYIQTKDSYAPGESAFEEYYFDYQGAPPTVGRPEGGQPYLYDSDGNSKVITWGRKVAKEDYKMLVLVNMPGDGVNGPQYSPNDLVFEVTKGSSLDVITKPLLVEPGTMGFFWIAINDESINYGITSNNYFFMSNHQGLIPVNASDIQESANAANENPISVNVGRAMAKVSLNTTYNTTVTNGASVEFLDWELDAVNRYMYPVRRLTNLLEDGGGKGALETLNDGSLRKNQYAEDPNFTGLSSAEGATDAEREAQLAYIYKKSTISYTVVKEKYQSEGTGTFPVYLPATVPNLTPVLEHTYNRAVLSDPVYCLENTFDVSDQSSEVMTAIMVRAKYIPSGFTTNESYFVYNSTLLSMTQMAGFADDPATIGNYVELDGLEEAMAESGLGSSTAVNALTASFERMGLRYYHAGINYYRIPIKHHTDESLNPANGDYYGYYGVVRNNHYAISIGRVVGFGKPTLKPEEPGDDGIQPVVRIIPWEEKPLNYNL